MDKYNRKDELMQTLYEFLPDIPAETFSGNVDLEALHLLITLIIEHKYGRNEKNELPIKAHLVKTPTAQVTKTLQNLIIPTQLPDEEQTKHLWYKVAYDGFITADDRNEILKVLQDYRMRRKDLELARKVL